MPIEDPVLVVVDMQNGFVNENSRPVVENIKSLVQTCRRRHIPTVFTRFINSSGSPFETLIDWPHVAAEPAINIVDELVGLAETVIDKSYYTAFTEEFSRLVQRHSWKTLILCGIATECCVLKTAADTFEYGLRPIVILDACASNAGDEAHQAGLLVLNYLIGSRQIITSAGLLRDLDLAT
jgi:nicotinamidase-related amidase